jgi:hypothetical protein
MWGNEKGPEFVSLFSQRAAVQAARKTTHQMRKCYFSRRFRMLLTTEPSVLPITNTPKMPTNAI